jgi:PKD repeat protein
MASITRYSAVVLLAVAVASCTTKKTEAPAPSGPSEFGTSLVLTASPDLLTQDGQSTSQIVIQARDANSQPARNVPLRIDIIADGAITDFGSVSQKSISTGSDGRATIVYRAPEPVGDVVREVTVSIAATPLTGDARGNTPRTVDIRLVPEGTVGGETPVPDFQFSPEDPLQLQTVTFDASDPDLDSILVHYAWDFDDGGKSTGRTVNHQFEAAGNYGVTLTVTDRAGRRGSRSKNVQVETSGVPASSFVFSPTEPAVGQDIIFNGAGSTAVPPRAIVSYKWVFGDGDTDSGMIASHSYDDPGAYNVTLTVTDDAGNQHTSSQEVEVVP